MRLSFQHIQKSFGSQKVLQDISFSVESGTALGLLGRNGAGKTTSIRILLDIISADGGNILLDGKPLDRSTVSFSYLPEERGLYPKKNVLTQLQYIGQLKGLSGAESKKQATRLLMRMQLESFAQKRLETLSKGNQQKIQLIAALIGDPQIIVLDEPFSGLDPGNAKLLKALELEQTAQGKPVLFSSHQMSYVEEFCENIAILHQGKIVLSGKLSQIKKGYPRNRVQVEGIPESQIAAIEALPMVVSLSQQNEFSQITLSSPQEKDALLHSLIAMNVSIERFEVMEPTLEEIFVEKAGDSL